MRKSSGKSGRGPGTVTNTMGKTSIASTMRSPIGNKGGVRASATRLKRRPTTGR